MRRYETMYILNPTLDSETIDSKIKRYEDLVSQYAGEVVDIDRWGRRRLAYEIDDLREGYYVVMTFSGNHDLTSEMDRLFRLDESVLRHMVVRLDEE